MALATIHEPTKEGGVTKLLPGPSECSERIEIIEYRLKPLQIRVVPDEAFKIDGQSLVHFQPGAPERGPDPV